MRAKTKVMEKQKKDGDTGKRINRKKYHFVYFIVNFSWTFLIVNLQPGAISECSSSDLEQLPLSV